MSFVTLKMSAAAIGGTIMTQYSGPVTVASDGTVTVSALDAPSLLAAGATFVNVRTGNAYYAAPLAASAAKFVASVALTNGLLTIAAQPDVPRQAQVVVTPGAAAITAGTLTAVYTAADGTTQTDVFSLITAASTNLTINLSKGAMFFTSFTVAAVAGGSSPTIEIGSTASLALPVDANAVDVAVVYEADTDAPKTPGAVTFQSCYAPSSAPNATLNYSIAYTFTAPNS